MRTVLISGGGIAGPVLAHLLHRHGFAPTVVERAPGVRGGGQAVDIRGVALDVVGRMGLLERASAVRTRMRGMSILGPDGSEVGRSTEATFSSGRLRRRGHRGAARGPGADGPRAHPRGRRVPLRRHRHRTRGRRERSARGVRAHGAAHLRPRRRGGRPALHRAAPGLRPRGGLRPPPGQLPLGVRRGQLPRTGGLADVAAGRGHGLRHHARARQHRTAHRLRLRVRPLAPGLRTAEALRRTVVDRLETVRWEGARLAEAARKAPDFYCDAMAQIRMDQWSRGRVALLGDAGYCPSPSRGRAPAWPWWAPTCWPSRSPEPVATTLPRTPATRSGCGPSSTSTRRWRRRIRAAPPPRNRWSAPRTRSPWTADPAGTGQCTVAARSAAVVLAASENCRSVELLCFVLRRPGSVSMVLTRRRACTRPSPSLS